jgi:hypothetical protein
MLRAAMLAVLVAATSLIAASAARAVTLSAGASTAHPYSNPVWWPLGTASTMGCYRGNPTLDPTHLPTCQKPQIQHAVWAMDIISAKRTVANPREPVYAMGAGIVHYGATRQGCGGASSRGNWIWIDHGNGVLSQYGHLGVIAVKSGAYVTARTKIAEIGNSGYSNCKQVNNMRYLYLAIKHGGTNGSYYHFTSTLACVKGVAQSWPRALSRNPRGAWTDWNQVPSHQVLDAPSPSHNSCIPATPATANAPSGAAMVHPGAAKLKAVWRAPAASARVTTVNVQFQLWHPSIGQWLDLENRHVSAALTSTIFSGLTKGRHYRMRVSFANSVGWSAATGWHNATAS